MKNQPSKNLVTKLHRIKEELGVFGSPDSKAALLESLDDMISSLKRLRSELTNPTLEMKAAEVKAPLEQVIRFLEQAKSDEALQVLLSFTGIAVAAKPKREPVQIPENLTNDAIRALLQKDLTKAELKAIAMQRAISVGENTVADIKRSILRNLERQEGYGRLTSS